jgi:hypothetical protein
LKKFPDVKAKKKKRQHTCRIPGYPGRNEEWTEKQKKGKMENTG